MNIVDLDGPAELHNQARVDQNGKGTFNKVMRAKQLMDNHLVDYNVLVTLTASIAHHPKKVWNFFIDKVKYLQFTPCLDGFDDGSNPFALTPKLFAYFYKNIFDLWLAEWKKSNYVSVKLFDDLINLLAGRGINTCGMIGQCSRQIVVEADGSTYPCDFFMLDDMCIGNLCKKPLMKILNTHKAVDFLHSTRNIPLCGECNYRKICGGGCKRMQRQTCYTDGDTYCGYRDFLDYAMDDMLLIVRTIR